jgi:hypothetical protein
MPLVAGHQAVCAGGIGTFQKLVVAGGLRDLRRLARFHNLRLVLDERKNPMLCDTPGRPGFRLQDIEQACALPLDAPRRANLRTLLLRAINRLGELGLAIKL